MKRIITFLILFSFIINVNAKVNAQSIENESVANDIMTTQVESMWPNGFPNINSDAAIVMEASTGTLLYEKNMHETFYPASITKILTTLIALESSSMNEVVTFSKNAVFDVDLDSSRIGIDVGEQLTMEQCLNGIMLESANEVSYAVAEHIAGDIESFSKLMNEKAKELGALNSNFVNPHGLPDPNHYTTAYDMAMIARAAIQNDAFREITGSRTYTIPPTNIQEETRYLANHHKFIKNKSFEGVIGGKTGYTSLAKYTLVTFAKRNGMTLISVVMHSPSSQDEYNDSANLLNYSFENFNLNRIENLESPAIESELGLFTKYRSFFNTSNSPLKVSQNGSIVLPNNVSFANTERKVELIPITQLVEGENKIGSITYYYKDHFIGETDIIFNNVDAPTLSKSLYISAPKVIPEDPEKVLEDQKESNLKSILIGIFVGIIVLAVGLYLIFIEIPHLKRRKRYKQRRFRRK